MKPEDSNTSVITIVIVQFILEVRFISILAEYKNSSVQLVLLNIHRVNIFVKLIPFFCAHNNHFL
jgi:hypothetical protein